MTMIVYTVSGSPRGWRALLGLTFKRLDFEIHNLNLSAREHKSEPYLTLNPRGTVPTLVAGDCTITDSLGILAWLDHVHPERPLFGRDAKEMAAVWSATRDATTYLRTAHNRLFLPIFFQGASEATRELQAAAEALKSELARLENDLKEGPFLVGDHPTAVDAICYPEIRLIQRAVETSPDLMAALGFSEPMTAYPRIADWKKKVEAVEGFDKTLPPHWNA